MPVRNGRRTRSKKDERVEKTFEYRIYQRNPAEADTEDLRVLSLGLQQALAKNARELVVNGVTAVEEMLCVAYAE